MIDTNNVLLFGVLALNIFLLVVVVLQRIKIAEYRRVITQALVTIKQASKILRESSLERRQRLTDIQHDESEQLKLADLFDGNDNERN